jgi:polysaccharide export outer membrane protein
MRFVWDNRAPVLARALIFMVLIAGAVQSAWAQGGQAPSQAQLEIFRNLPPDQQQAVLESMQGDASSEFADQEPTSEEDAAATARRARDRADERDAREDIGPPRASSESTLILNVTTREDVAEIDRQRIEARRDRIREGNPFKLDGEARLHLPFLEGIPVGGLTDKEVAQRLNADPRLTGLHFTVTLLPVEPVGVAALKPFGYDLFKEASDRFAPSADLAAPAGYIVGPGDNITVELFGKKTGRYRLVVNRDGALVLPDFGPIQVTGMSYEEVRSEIEQRVSDQMIGVRASVTMGQLRSLRVFVVGDVAQPGAHSVSALSTITGALYASGGISEVGSLRNIELKRRGATVSRFDLYDLLLRGDTSSDVQLQQGDAIFVPPLGLTASVAGEARRPAIYEFRTGATVGDLVQMSGGLTPQSAAKAATLQRIDVSGERIVVNVDLSASSDRARPVRTGDVLTIPRVLDEYASSVTVEGHVHRPGPYAWRQGMRLSDLLGSLDAMKLNADQRYILIRRERMPDRQLQAISADAIAAFSARGGSADPVLESRDRVIVFSRQPDRGAKLSSLLEELRLQVRDNQPLPLVTINGRVRAPGDYPLESEMTVSDLVRAGGGMDDAAYARTAELTRYEVVNGEARKTEVIDLELGGSLDGSVSSDIRLRPYDVLVVKEVPDWREQESVILGGEVRFPGTYPIRYGETLSSLVERAGGLTEAAFPDGAVFMREEIKAQEREQIETLANRLQSDLTFLALQSSQAQNQQASETLAAGQALLQQLRTAEPKGRLVIDLQHALARQNSEDDIQLRGGDTLLVPRLRQYVNVIGEVQNATAHVWKSDLSKVDYIEMSGGTTPRADDKRIYVVRANGSVVATSGKRWFSSSQGGEVEPGSTVVVPIDAERMRSLPLWTAVTTIIYNLAVSVAAIGSL